MRDWMLCIYCGEKLPAARVAVIRRLRKSSAKVLARGACDPCWDKKHVGESEVGKKPKKAGA